MNIHTSFKHPCHLILNITSYHIHVPYMSHAPHTRPSCIHSAIKLYACVVLWSFLGFPRVSVGFPEISRRCFLDFLIPNSWCISWLDHQTPFSIHSQSVVIPTDVLPSSFQLPHVCRRSNYMSPCHCRTVLSSFLLCRCRCTLDR